MTGILFFVIFNDLQLKFLSNLKIFSILITMINIDHFCFIIFNMAYKQFIQFSNISLKINI